MGKKHREDEEEAERPDAWEQFRVLLDAVDQGRRITELVDHKIRYALVLIGVVNAAVLYLATRSDLRAGAPSWLLLTLLVLAILYMIAMFAALWYVIKALRPRRLAVRIGSQGPADPGRPQVAGLLLWEGVVQRDLEAYRERWDRATMEELNHELIVIAHSLSRLIETKYSSLSLTYNALFLVLALATAIIGLEVGFRFR